MRRIGEHIRGVACGILFIGLSVQIVLGLFWMCANFPGFQEFGESFRYVEISKSFLCDEYTGILYPVLIMVARGIGELLHLPYYMVLYGAQLVVALFAAHRFLWGCRFVFSRKEAAGKAEAAGKGTAAAWSAGKAEAEKTESPAGKQGDGGRRLLWDIWGSLCLLTVPMAMQCHLAVLPYSLAGSFYLIMLSFVAEAAGRPEKLYVRTLVEMAPLWLVTALLLPDYRFLAALPLVGLFVYSACCLWRRDKARVARQALLLLAFGGTILALGSLTQMPGSQGKVRRSFAASMVSRFVWPEFAGQYDMLPEEVRAVFSLDDARETDKAADSVAAAFGPAVEKAVGRREARRLFWEMARTAWEGNARGITRQILLDAASYAISPAALPQQLKGRGYESYSGRNYEIMRDRTPGLTRDYVRYAGWWFPVGVLLSGVVFLTILAERAAGGRRLYGPEAAGMGRGANSPEAAGMGRGANSPEAAGMGRRANSPELSGVPRGRAGRHACAVLCMVSAFFMVAFYTMQGAGMMDYKNTVFSAQLWYVWMLLGIRYRG